MGCAGTHLRSQKEWRPRPVHPRCLRYACQFGRPPVGARCTYRPTGCSLSVAVTQGAHFSEDLRLCSAHGCSSIWANDHVNRTIRIAFNAIWPILLAGIYGASCLEGSRPRLLPVRSVEVTVASVKLYLLPCHRAARCRIISARTRDHRSTGSFPDVAPQPCWWSAANNACRFSDFHRYRNDLVSWGNSLTAIYTPALGSKKAPVKF